MNIKQTDIDSFLVVQEPSLIKQYVICSMIFINIPSVVVMICEPFIPDLFYFFISITLIVSIFSVFIIFNASHCQILYSLYSGITCLAISIVYYLCFYKLIFEALNISVPGIKYGSFIVYLGLIIAAFILPFHFVKKGYYSSNRKVSKKSQKINANAVCIIGFSIGIGLLAGRFLTNYGSYNSMLLGGGIACLILSLIIILGIPNIHKYFIMKKFIEYVPLYPVEKKKK